jgi:hypothetical protein
VIDLTPADLTRLTELLHEHGGPDGLVQAAGAGARSGSHARRQPVPFRDASQVLDALAGEVITRDEARRLLGVPARRRTTRSKGETS